MTIFELAVMSCLTLSAPYSPLGDTTTTCSWRQRGAYVLSDRCEADGKKAIGEMVFSDVFFIGAETPRISQYRCTPRGIID